MEGHPVFLRLWRRGYGASWGGNSQQLRGQFFSQVFEFSALQLNFTPHGEVAQITLIYLEGSVGRFICKFCSPWSKSILASLLWDVPVGSERERRMATASSFRPSLSKTTALRNWSPIFVSNCSRPRCASRAVSSSPLAWVAKVQSRHNPGLGSELASRDQDSCTLA